MSLFVERKLDTAFGPVDISITRGEHISVQGQPVVRDSRFNCHLHFWLQPDGTFAVRFVDNPNMTRSWDATKSRSFNESAPKSYFAKVLAEYTQVLNTFLASNPSLLTEAEDADLNRQIGASQAKIDELEEKLEAERRTLAGLRCKVSELNGYDKLEAFPDL
jgi:hypothetical protein